MKHLAQRHGALLIFDEICSGFHFGLGGAQKLFGVTPDLACFGKAMGNGFPISCVLGRADVMRIFEEIFYSFTFAGEVASMAAAMKVLDILEQTDALARMESNGRTLQDGVNAMAKEAGLGQRIRAMGRPQWSLLKFSDQRRRRQSAVEESVSAGSGEARRAVAGDAQCHGGSRRDGDPPDSGGVCRGLQDAGVVGRRFQSRALSGRAHDSTSVPGAMNLLFRTDASLTMGTGHVMRCLALAQAWQDAGGRAVFAMAETHHGAFKRGSRPSRAKCVRVSCVAGTEAGLRARRSLWRENWRPSGSWWMATSSMRIISAH